jgi:hypothetical protein
MILERGSENYWLNGGQQSLIPKVWTTKPRSTFRKYLKDSNSTWRASNATLDMQWRTCHEESVSLHALTLLSKSLKIPHLANRHAPVDQQPLMQAPAISELWWPGLKGDSVTDKTCKMMVIQPANRVLVGLDAYSDTVIPRAGFSFRFVCLAVNLSV